MLSSVSTALYHIWHAHSQENKTHPTMHVDIYTCTHPHTSTTMHNIFPYPCMCSPTRACMYIQGVYQLNCGYCMYTCMYDTYSTCDFWLYWPIVIMPYVIYYHFCRYVWWWVQVGLNCQQGRHALAVFVLPPAPVFLEFCTRFSQSVFVAPSVVPFLSTKTR